MDVFILKGNKKYVGHQHMHATQNNSLMENMLRKMLIKNW